MLVNPLLKGKVQTPHGLEPVLLPEHRPWIYLVFGCGFAAVFLVFFLLYRHAYRRREQLGLNELEIYETRHSMRRMLVAVMVGVSYFALAGMQSLPQKTEQQKRVVIVVAVAVLLLFIGLFVTIARLARERRRTRKEWHSRQSESSAENGDGVGDSVHDDQRPR
jgi:flagellar biosynthesis/type III secretory pathway M-ring protein FliF/YscJ